MLLPRPLLSWRILDLLKIQSSPKPSRSPSLVRLSAQLQPPPETTVARCSCCGTVLLINGLLPETAPDSVAPPKFRCSQCHTTNLFGSFDSLLHSVSALDPIPKLSLSYVRELAALCLSGIDTSIHDPHLLHERLRPLLTYLLAAFGDFECLSLSFQIRKRSRRPHYSTCNLDLAQARAVFDLLRLLPSRQPLYCALTAASNRLKRLPVNLCDNALNLSWVVVLFQIPFLHKALTAANPRSAKKRPMAEVPEIQALCYDILKRILGIFSQAAAAPAGNYLASWFSKLPDDEFSACVDLINLYITFHLKNYFHLANNLDTSRRGSSGAALPDNSRGAVRRASCTALASADNEYFQLMSVKEELGDIEDDIPGWSRVPISNINLPRKGRSKQVMDSKIRLHQYTQDYHLRTAAEVLDLFSKANYIRVKEHKIPIDAFYNSLVDYVNVKLDFDVWLSKRKKSAAAPQSEPALQTVIDYIHGSAESFIPFDDEPQVCQFYLCQFPFLISLGGKIAILEYEARRQMERKAEEAFINSLDRRVALEVYFKVRVRRDFIVQDSLLCIQLNQNNLKKSLRVQFVNEPGIDAGGLKKEWFLLLTKSLFSPLAGMLYNVEGSNYLWFGIIPAKDHELYYLLGAVLGLAIYNSTILDLKFPLALYKVLLGLPLGLADYKDVFPEPAANLFKLRDFNAEELEALELTFEVTFQDCFGTNHLRELISGGGDTIVTIDNRELFIDKYARFFLSDGIEKQLTGLKNGFSSVVDGNAFSLFQPEEIQLLLCGSEQSQFDVDVLKSVTSYVGWGKTENALECAAVKWFWEYLAGLLFSQQKKVLLFITGSDRVPATGIQNMTLKISRLDGGSDSDRLPVAHTCFNELAIYEYSTKAKMFDKLTKAVYMLAGFGIK